MSANRKALAAADMAERVAIKKELNENLAKISAERRRGTDMLVAAAARLNATSNRLDEHSERLALGEDEHTPAPISLEEIRISVVKLNGRTPE